MEREVRKRAFGAGGGFPAVGGDFDELAVGVGEVEEDAVGDAVGSRDGRRGGRRGGGGSVRRSDWPGFEVIEEGVELAGGGQGVVAAVEFEEEPVVEGGGADGEDEEASAVEGDADEGLAVVGGEGEAGLDDGGEFGEGIGWHKVPLNSRVTGRTSALQA